MWCSCSKCGSIKPLWGFNRSAKKKFGISTYCKKCDTELSKIWLANNKDKRSGYRKEYYNLNKDKEISKMKLWSINNRDKHNAIKSKYKKSNPDKYAAIEAVRRARKLNQTDDLNQYDKLRIDTLYTVSDLLGKDFQVDHIVPISKGGSHHPDNLQIVRKIDNLKKNNKVNYSVVGFRLF